MPPLLWPLERASGVVTVSSFRTAIDFALGSEGPEGAERLLISD